MKLFLGFFAICIAIGILVTFWPLVFFIAAIFAILKVYETFYFTSGKFESIKERIQSYINDCNDLNRHIEDLKKKWGLHKNVHLLMNVSNISEYMKSCDIAVTAGGVTTYELCACGIPSIMYTLADNQLQIAQMASEKCFIPWIGDVRGDMENCMYNIILWLEELMADKEKRERMSSKMQEIVDGNGCERLVAEIKTYHKLQKA